jgi:hypothetical protein
VKYILCLLIAITAFVGCESNFDITDPVISPIEDTGILPDPIPTPIPAPHVAPETRGVWLNPYSFRDANARTDIMRKIRQAHLNTIFVVAPSIGPNYGWSEANSFLAFIKIAHEAGLKVHAWVGNKNRLHDGQVDFRDPAEQQAQAQWALDIVQTYGQWLDGFHLDFIRYSTWLPVNSGGWMDGVTATVAKIRASVRSYNPRIQVTAAVFPTGAAAANFQQEDIPQWFRSWFDSHPGNYYATATPQGQSVPEHMKFQQDPVGWVVKDLLDAFMPMQYTMSDARWNNEVGLWNSFFASTHVSPAKLWMGLGWLTETGRGDWGYDAAGIVRKIKEGRRQGIGGFVIFEMGRWDSGNRDEELIAALTKDSPVNGYAAPFKD